MPLTLSKEQLDAQIELIKQTTGLNPVSPAAIGEYLRIVVQFLDERAKLSEDFVTETNSSTFIQQSLAQVEDFKTEATTAASDAETKRAATQLLMGLTEGYRNQVLSLKEQMDSNTVVSRVFQDSVNFATNTPNLSGLTLNNTTDKGKYWKVGPGGSGNTSITGSVVTAKEGDEFTWNGTKWVWTANNLLDGSVSRQKLSADVTESIVGTIEIMGYQIPIWMNPAMEMALWGDMRTGKIRGNFDLSDSEIPEGSLPETVTNGLMGQVDIEFANYIPIWMHPESASMGIFADKINGRVYIPDLVLKEKAVSELNLSDSIIGKLPSTAFTRLNASNQYDVDIVDDDLLRGTEFEIPTRTTYPNGFVFSQFPNVKTPSLRGVNDTGFDLLFRQVSAPIRGKLYRGTFDIASSAVQGKTLKGVYGNSYSNTYPAFPAGITGDCWITEAGNSAVTVTANGLTFKNGDCLVKTDTGYAIQTAPGNGTYQIGMRNGEFWNVISSGYFGGKFYEAGSKMYLLGLQSQSGPKHMKYAKSKDGELYVIGECDASFVAPAAPQNGDTYIFSVNAIILGLSGQIGDLLTYYKGAWGIMHGQLATIPNGRSFNFPCTNAKEWSVRRIDKLSNELNIKAWGHKTSVRRKTTDSLILYSDSMFGGVGNKILALSGRSGNVQTYGGGSSFDVLAMVKDWILNSDTYVGRVHTFWHGQNNSTDVTQIKYAAHQMASLIGSKEARYVFWSILGSRTNAWNGERLTCPVQEGAFAGTNTIAEVEKFYESAYPGQYFSPRKALLEVAATRTNVADVQYPGLSEAQSAATYGIVPFSFWFDFSDKPFTQNNITFLGYHNAVGLPTGGVDKNYYLRTGNGVSGNMIVNVAGVWTEYNGWDSIHLNSAGQDAAAAKYVDFLTLHNI